MPTKRNNSTSKRAKSAAPKRHAKKAAQPSLLDETLDFSHYSEESVSLGAFCHRNGFKVRIREREERDIKVLGLGRYYAYIEGLFALSDHTPLDSDGRIPEGAILQSICVNTNDVFPNHALQDLANQLSGKTLVLSRGEFGTTIIRAPKWVFHNLLE